MRTWLAGIVRRVTVWRIRRNGCCIRVRDALRLTEEGQENERSKNSALQNDRNRQCASAKPALAATLSGIAFDETSTQRTKPFFRYIFRNLLRLERHHTPPHNLLPVFTALPSLRTALQKFCGADFLGVALDLQETGAALAGM